MLLKSIDCLIGAPPSTDAFLLCCDHHALPPEVIQPNVLRADHLSQLPVQVLEPHVRCERTPQGSVLGCFGGAAVHQNPAICGPEHVRPEPNQLRLALPACACVHGGDYTLGRPRIYGRLCSENGGNGQGHPREPLGRWGVCSLVLRAHKRLVHDGRA
jgi:hypothetical protein